MQSSAHGCLGTKWVPSHHRTATPEAANRLDDWGCERVSLRNLEHELEVGPAVDALSGGHHALESADVGEVTVGEGDPVGWTVWAGQEQR